MKGHKFLKITGILMIVSAAISILAGVFVGGLGALAAGLGAASGLTFSYWAALFLTLVGGICQLIAGVKGVKHCQRIEEAGKLIIWGAIVAVFCILSTVLSMANGGEFNFMSILTGVAVPALYIYGAVLNSKTEDEFAELCEFLQNVGIERVGVFEYSPEEGTEAAELPDQIDNETKQNRRLIVEELQSGVLDDYNTSRHGEVMQVLCEGFDEEQGLWYGRTYADSVEVDGHVYFDAADNEPAEGEFVSVLITESLGPDLLGVRQKEA